MTRRLLGGAMFVVAVVCCLVATSAECAQENPDGIRKTPASPRASGQADPSQLRASGERYKNESKTVSYRIAGVVVDAETSTPVGGAELSINEANVEMKTKADDEGRFAFAGLELGKYAVQASAPGYVREAYNQHRYFSTSMVVGSGLDSEHMVFRLHRQAVITGTVTDEHGEVVRHAQVMLFKEDRGGGKRTVQMNAQAQTDDLGAYRFAHLEAGKYYVAVSARPWYAQNGLTRQAYQSQFGGGDGGLRPSYVGQVFPKADGNLDVVYPTTFYPGVTDENSAGELVVSAGEIQQADVRLQAVPAVHLRLTNMPTGQENGQRAIGAMQRVFGSANMPAQATFGPIASGSEEIGGLPPGEVSLTIGENRNGEWENRTIHVNAGEDGSGQVDFEVSANMANLTGRVITADGGAAKQGNVALTGRQGQSISRNLQKDGTFSLAGVQADTYQISVNFGIGGDSDYVERITAKGAKVSGEEVTIEEGGDAQLVIRMGHGLGTVKGVVNAEGKPEAGVMVLLVPESGPDLERNARIDQSDSDGSFTLARIVPGKYLLVAIEDGWDLDWMEAGVLAPYREKGQMVEIGAEEVKSVKVEAEKKQKLEDGK